MRRLHLRLPAEQTLRKPSTVRSPPSKAEGNPLERRRGSGRLVRRSSRRRPLHSGSAARPRPLCRSSPVSPCKPALPNPLAGHPYVLLRDSYPANAVAKAGVSGPTGNVTPINTQAPLAAAGRPTVKRSTTPSRQAPPPPHVPMLTERQPVPACPLELTT